MESVFVSLATLTGSCFISLAGVAAENGVPMIPKTAALLETGEQPAKIVCFGDSITGVYYHTGGRRAYSDMLGIALQRIYPSAKLTMINAGISGNTTAQGLERLERDVLSHQPQLVTVMFGMNDVTGIPLETYRGNLQQIVAQCRAIGAEVVLCTPNSIYPEDERRPVDKLARFAEVVREVVREMEVPLADCWRAYEDLRAQDRRAWMLLLSETIHPNMNGHKVFAEEIAWVITGERVSLADVPPPTPALPRTLARLAAGETVTVVAMLPFDSLIEPALQRIFAEASVHVTPWPVAGQTLAQIETYAHDRIGWMHLQNHPEAPRPDLVLIAVPPDATAANEEQFIRSYSWVLNWSQSFGTQEWDCVAVLPSVVKPALSEEEQQREALARQVIKGQDIGFLERPAGDTSPAEALLERWLKQQGGEATT